MTDDGANVVELAAVLDLNAAAPLRERLLAQRGSAVVVDASKVERIGGQCLQVLLSARQSWQCDGMAFSITRASHNFASAIRQMGFAADLAPAMETTR